LQKFFRRDPALTFFIIAIASEIFGCTGMAATASGLAKIILFLILDVHFVALLSAGMAWRAPRNAVMGKRQMKMMQKQIWLKGVLFVLMINNLLQIE
jgi:uncharacterized membrane protein YtjA (UPF0391 family)